MNSALHSTPQMLTKGSTGRSSGLTVDHAVAPGVGLPTWCETDADQGSFGNPSVFMRTSSGAGLGLVALDDVLMVQGVFKNHAWNSPLRSPHADPSGRRHCHLPGTEPSIQLADPHFGLAPGKSYTLEWAIYPLPAPSSYYSFINQLRVDMGVSGALTVPGTGLLNAFNSGFFSVCASHPLDFHFCTCRFLTLAGRRQQRPRLLTQQQPFQLVSFFQVIQGPARLERYPLRRWNHPLREFHYVALLPGTQCLRSWERLCARHLGSVREILD